jgi:hypothetical protein
MTIKTIGGLEILRLRSDGDRKRNEFPHPKLASIRLFAWLA